MAAPESPGGFNGFIGVTGISDISFSSASSSAIATTIPLILVVSVLPALTGYPISQPMPVSENSNNKYSMSRVFDILLTMDYFLQPVVSGRA